MILDNDGVVPYRDWPYEETSIPSYLVFPLGSYGVLYPPGSLGSQLSDENLIQELAPLNDDVWFKAMTLMRDRPCRAWGGRVRFPPIYRREDVRLWDLNQRGELTDVDLNKVFDHFGLTADTILAKKSGPRPG
jgi:hypothetical protein